ncbi:hypothetical protein BGX27_003245 [Mortierella sp. AM989]|nr:hypothetical protein BGX27_003245 [Mortierella sp. AM989]
MKIDDLTQQIDQNNWDYDTCVCFNKSSRHHHGRYHKDIPITLKLTVNNVDCMIVLRRDPTCNMAYHCFCGAKLIIASSVHRHVESCKEALTMAWFRILSLSAFSSRNFSVMFSDKPKKLQMPIVKSDEAITCLSNEGDLKGPPVYGSSKLYLAGMEDIVEENIFEEVFGPYNGLDRNRTVVYDSHIDINDVSDVSATPTSTRLSKQSKRPSEACLFKEPLPRKRRTIHRTTAKQDEDTSGDSISGDSISGLLSSYAQTSERALQLGIDNETNLDTLQQEFSKYKDTLQQEFSKHKASSEMEISKRDEKISNMAKKFNFLLHAVQKLQDKA